MGVNLFRVMIVVKSAAIMFFFCASLSTKAEASRKSILKPSVMRTHSCTIRHIMEQALDGEAGDHGGTKDRGDSPDDLANGDRVDDGDHGDDRDDKLLNEDDNRN
ncbi:hypothetical protein MRX96_021354 [Rhipicephalus microplus]